MTISKKSWWTLAAIVAIPAGLATWAQLASSQSTDEWVVRVTASFSHDPNAYTQGLVISDGQMYEGTGQYGASSIRKVDLTTGLVEKRSSLAPIYFGEGITILNGRLYQLTWKAGVGFVYDLETFELLRTFRIESEGWGLTHDGEHLIVSDGSSELQFLDPETFAVVRRVTVRDSGQSVERLNELEYIRGEVWANVWYEDRIVRISPADGQVLGWIDLDGLYPRSQRRTDDVLNGIAFDSERNRLFVTGKNWPRLYEIETLEKDE